MTILLDVDIGLFFGRFHPVLVHLPIGFILMALILEIIARWNSQSMDPAVEYCLVFAIGAGTLAIIFGLLLASDGGYSDDALNLHKWTGIATIVLSVLTYLLKRYNNQNRISKRLYFPFFVLTALVLTLTGHFGANLTHGSGYLLEYAPNPVRRIAGLAPHRERITSLDSAWIYQDVVQTIFQEKCTVCHNGDKEKGKLRLTDPEYIQSGGENGPVIVPENPAKSELIRRVTLDPNHDDFMPTEGRTPLSLAEISLLEWWIENGAPFEVKLKDLIINSRIKEYLAQVGIGMNKSFLERLTIPELAPGILDSLESAGFTVKPVVEGTGLLDVAYSLYGNGKIDRNKLQLLLKARENIVWLDLSGNFLEDDWLHPIGQLNNITRLNLSNTAIGDAGIESLVLLKNLEYLNLYGTEVSDAAIPFLIKLEMLKDLYIWQTGISEKGEVKLLNSSDIIMIERGMSNNGIH